MTDQGKEMSEKGPLATAARSANHREAGVGGRLIAAVAHPETRRSLLSLLDQAIVSGASFGTSIIVGRLCPADELGIYYLVLTIVWLLQDVFWELITVPYGVYCHRRQGASLAGYRGSTLIHQLLMSAVVILGLLTYYVILVGAGSTGLATSILVLAGAAPLMLLREYIRQISFAHLRSGVALAIDSTVAVLQLAGFVLLAFAGTLNAATAYSVIGTACGVAALAWLVFKKRPLQFAWADTLADWRRNWAFGRWAMASLLIGSATSYVMPWIILLARDTSKAGLLGLCTTLIGVPNMVIMGMCNSLRPRMFREFAENGRDGLKRMLWISSLAFGFAPGMFLLLVLVFGDWPATFVYGSQALGSGWILVALAVGKLASGTGMAPAAALWAVDRPQDNLAPNTWDCGVSLLAAAVLVPAFGVLGAALAIMAGQIAGTISRVLKLRTVFAVHIDEPRHLQDSAVTAI